METSLLKTLASKHRSTVSKMARKHRTTIKTPHGPRRCFEARVEREGRKPLVARFGGIPLKRQRAAILTDRQPNPVIARKELIKRLLAGKCELCGHAAPVEVHHTRTLAELTNTGEPHQPTWTKIMAKRRRKTLVICDNCHTEIHSTGPTTATTQ